MFAFVFNCLSEDLVLFVGSGWKYNSIARGQKRLSIEKPAKAGKLGKYQQKLDYK